MPVIDLGSGKVKKNQPPQGKRVIDLDTGETIPVAAIVTPQEKQAKQQQALAAINENLGPLESLSIATGRGLYDIARSVGFVDDEDEIVKKAFADLEEKRPISQTVGRATGQALPFMVPGAAIGNIASLPARVVGATGLGALEGAAISEGMGTGETQDAAIQGGIIAGGFEVSFPLLSRLGRGLVSSFRGSKPSVPVVNKLGEPSKELQEALSQAGMSFDDLIEQAQSATKGKAATAQQATRKQALADVGINNPTRAQVTGDVGDFQTQQELFKRPGKVRNAIEQQDQTLFGGFSNKIDQTGVAPSASQSHNPVVTFVSDKAIKEDTAISNAYSAVRELTDSQKAIPTPNLIEKLRGMTSSGTATGGLPGAVRDILREHGVLQPGKGLKSISKIDANTAEQIRIGINGLHNTVTDLGRGKIRELKQALDDDVMAIAGEDAFKEVRAIKSQFEKSLARTKNNKFDKRNKEFVRDILGNKYNPDTFFNDAILTKSTRSSDVEQLKRYLESDSSGEALEAWNSVRSDAMEWIRDNAFSEVGGVMALSRNSLDKALNRIGRDKMRVIFTPDERQFLKNMRAAAAIREPKRETFKGLGPSAQAVQSLQRGVINNSLIADVFKFIKISSEQNKALTIPAPIRPLEGLPSSITRASAVAATSATGDEEKN